MSNSKKRKLQNDLENVQLLVSDEDEHDVLFVDQDNLSVTTDTDLSMDMEWDLECSFDSASNVNVSSDEEVLPDVINPIMKEFILKLTDWCIRSQTSRDYMDELLSLLISINIPVPKTTKTLLQTPTRSVQPLNMGPGEFIYFGIENMLMKIDHPLLRDANEIILKVDSDGVPKFKNSSMELIPMNGEIVNIKEIPLFPILVYRGDEKPSVDAFFKDFCTESVRLMRDGVMVTKAKIKKPFTVLLFCGDAPQRAWMAGVRGHTSKHGCHMCDQVAKKINGRLTYSSTRGLPRTDQSYTLRSCPEHHQPEFLNEPTLLEKNGFGIVTQIPVEDMHLIHLGVIRKTVKQIMKNDCNITVSQEGRDEMERKIRDVYHLIPRAEFARRPRSLKYVHKYKATEGRLFCLYIGIVILKNSVPDEIYDHFLYLTCASRLISQTNAKQNAVIANLLFERYVDNFPAIYGEDRLSYNVHNLLHICECVERYGDVNVFSAYRNENYLQQIKKFVKKPTGVLQQIANRMEEVHKLNNRIADAGFLTETLAETKPLFPNCPSYSGYKFDQFVLRATPADAYCQIFPNIQLRVEQFANINGEDMVIGYRFQVTEPFFDSPMDSREVGIFMCSQLSKKTETFRVARIQNKFIYLPYKDKSVLVAVLHHIN